MARLLLLPLVLLILVSVAPPAEAASCRGAGTAPAAQGASAAGAAIECLVNRRRVRHGLPRLRANHLLRAAGAAHAGDMAGRRYFAHTSMDGTSPGDRAWAAGYQDPRRHWLVGENLAWGVAWKATPAGIVGSWMKSPSHRSLILDRRFRELGVGVVTAVPVTAAAAGSAATVAAEFGVKY